MRTITEALFFGLIISVLAGAIIYETNKSVQHIKQTVLQQHSKR